MDSVHIGTQAWMGVPYFASLKVVTLARLSFKYDINRGEMQLN